MSVTARSFRVSQDRPHGSSQMLRVSRAPAVLNQSAAATQTIDASPSDPWLTLLAGVSFTAAAGGLVGSLIAPGPVVGLAFPLGLLGIWVTSRLAAVR